MTKFSSSLACLRQAAAAPLVGLALLLAAGAASAQTPSFATQAAFATGTGTKPSSVAAADVNGDGKPDLLVANSNSNTVG
ncbi:VCBS repeat-containing protein, partial [Hymenobacter sp. BT770]